MNAREYISSGILELYATGSLPPDQAREVELVAAEYPEVRAELDAVISALAGYVAAHRVNPPPELRPRIMRSIEAELKVIAMPRAVPEPPPQQDGVRPLYSGARYLAAASLTLFVISGGLAAYFYGKWNNTDQELRRMVAGNRVMAGEFSRTKSSMDKIARDLNVMRDDSVMMISMKGMGGSPDARARVYWDKRGGGVYLDVVKLASAAQDRQYQLWAIVDGKPVDAGVFDANGSNLSLISMKSVPRGAAAFAVTVERRGGSPVPTMKTMCLLGEVPKGA